MLCLRIIQDMDTSPVILHVIFTYNTGYGYQPGNITCHFTYNTGYGYQPGNITCYFYV